VFRVSCGGFGQARIGVRMGIIVTSHPSTLKKCAFERRNARFGIESAVRLANERTFAGINTTNKTTKQSAF
jgi:hypothetical protein